MQRHRFRRRRGVGAVVAGAVLVALLVAGCSDDSEPEDAPPATFPPVVTTPSTVATAPPVTLACGAQVLLQVLQAQGGQFDLSPTVLGGLTPTGPTKCDETLATQSFSGPPEAPGPFAALFRITPDRTAWELASVNCRSSVESGQRQMC